VLPRCVMKWLSLGGMAVVMPVMAATPVIKQSSSGICHPQESSWYDRTQTYDAFDSVAACLEAGGRLPDGLSMESLHRLRNPVEAPDGGIPPYDRDAFGYGWQDKDGDCQDTRAEVLIVRSAQPARFASHDQCRVIAGRWQSLFTGDYLHDADEVQIDHLIALEWAWQRGAWQWSEERRERFANDPANLLIVEGSLNVQQAIGWP